MKYQLIPEIAGPSQLKAMGILALALLLTSLAGLTGCSAGTPEAREADHMRRAQGYLRRQNYAKATIEFKIAAQTMPTDAEPVYQLAMTYLRRGAWQPAIEALRKALELNPKHQAAQLQLALFKVGSNKLELLREAKEVLTAHIAGHPRDAQACGSLALVEAKLDDKAGAIGLLKDAAGIDPGNLRPAELVIAVYAAKGDMSAAKEIARALAEHLPHSPQAAVLVAQVSMAALDVTGADAQISRALSLKKDFLPALQLRLRRELISGNRRAAEQTARELSQLPEKQVWPAYARVLFSEKSIDQGAEEFLRVLKQHGNLPELRDEFSALLASAGRSKEAMDIVDGTLAKHPKDSIALLQRVTLNVDKGNFESATQDVKTLQEMKAFPADLSYQQARILGARGDRIRAGDLLAESLRYNPGFLAARLQLSRLLVASGKAKDALLTLDQASANDKLTKDYLYYHNSALIAAGNWDAARKGVDAGLRAVGGPGFLYQDAALRIGNGDLAGARRSLESGLQLVRSDVDMWNLLGDVMRKQGESGKYTARLQEAAAKNLSSAPLQNMLGAHLVGLGDLNGARAAFEAAKTAGDAVNAELEIATLDLRVGDLDQAKKRTLDLVESHDSARAQMLLAEIETRKESPADPVIKHYLRALELEPANIVAMNNLAATLSSRQKKFDDALFWSQKALALAPSSPVLQDTLGWIYYLQGKYDDALPYLERSSAGLDRAVAHYHLAAALIKAGDKMRGRKEYELALKEDPQSATRDSVAVLFEKK